MIQVYGTGDKQLDFMMHDFLFTFFCQYNYYINLHAFGNKRDDLLIMIMITYTVQETEQRLSWVTSMMRMIMMRMMMMIMMTMMLPGIPAATATKTTQLIIVC